jgi:hypothetical protein
LHHVQYSHRDHISYWNSSLQGKILWRSDGYAIQLLGRTFLKKKITAAAQRPPSKNVVQKVAANGATTKSEKILDMTCNCATVNTTFSLDCIMILRGIYLANPTKVEFKGRSYLTRCRSVRSGAGSARSCIWNYNLFPFFIFHCSYRMKIFSDYTRSHSNVKFTNILYMIGTDSNAFLV